MSFFHFLWLLSNVTRKNLYFGFASKFVCNLYYFFSFKPSKKILYILNKLLAGSSFLSSNEIKRAVTYCIPDHKELKIKMIVLLKNEGNNFIIKTAKRHPVILIVDEVSIFKIHKYF